MGKFFLYLLALHDNMIYKKPQMVQSRPGTAWSSPGIPSVSTAGATSRMVHTRISHLSPAPDYILGHHYQQDLVTHITFLFLFFFRLSLFFLIRYCPYDSNGNEMMTASIFGKPPHLPHHAELYNC